MVYYLGYGNGQCVGGLKNLTIGAAIINQFLVSDSLTVFVFSMDDYASLNAN